MSEYVRCPACGLLFSDTPDDDVEASRSATDLSVHVYLDHSNGACFCGYNAPAGRSIRGHVIDCGGWDAHWMDFLMGVTGNARQ